MHWCPVHLASPLPIVSWNWYQFSHEHDYDFAKGGHYNTFTLFRH